MHLSIQLGYNFFFILIQVSVTLCYTIPLWVVGLSARGKWISVYICNDNEYNETKGSHKWSSLRFFFFFLLMVSLRINTNSNSELFRNPKMKWRKSNKKKNVLVFFWFLCGYIFFEGGLRMVWKGLWLYTMQQK